MNERSKLRIGLALGSGSARGFSHIGIINELADHGVVPDIVCGSSVGAMIGASLSLCRALGADFIIAVNLNGDIVGKHFETSKKNRKIVAVLPAVSRTLPRGRSYR